MRCLKQLFRRPRSSKLRPSNRYSRHVWVVEDRCSNIIQYTLYQILKSFLVSARSCLVSKQQRVPPHVLWVWHQGQSDSWLSQTTNIRYVSVKQFYTILYANNKRRAWSSTSWRLKQKACIQQRNTRRRWWNTNVAAATWSSQTPQRWGLSRK